MHITDQTIGEHTVMDLYVTVFIKKNCYLILIFQCQKMIHHAVL